VQPNIELNYLAILAAVVANMVVGFLWYGPVFGKAWMSEMKLDPSMKPEPKVFARAMVLMVIGTFLTVYVLAHDIAVWMPSSWGLGPDSSAATYGFFAGFFIWLGYYVPVMLGRVGWENASWKLFFINTAYHFVALQIVGTILAHWR
jgi:hypothetical protein